MLQDFLLMLLFKGLIDYLFLLLIMLLIGLKETVIEKIILTNSKYHQLQCIN